MVVGVCSRHESQASARGDIRSSRDAMVWGWGAALPELALQVIGAPRHRIKTEVPEAIKMMGLDGMERRHMSELSGEERQIGWLSIAMLFFLVSNKK